MSTIQPAIQAFLSDDIPSPYQYQALPDWPRATLLLYDQSAPYPIVKFGFNTGAVQIASNVDGPNISYPLSPCIDSSGLLYMPTGVTNYAGIAQFERDLTQRASFGVPSGMDNQPDAIPVPDGLAAVTTNQCTFVVGVGLEHTIMIGPSIVMVTGGNNLKFGGHNFQTDGQTASICVGPQSDISGDTYTLTGPDADVKIQSVNVYLTAVTPAAITYQTDQWPTPNAYIATTVVGSVFPTDVDPEWATIYQKGCIWDGSDGHLIAMLHTTSAATNLDYIVKISTDDASILWKVAIPHPSVDTSSMGNGRTVHGTFCYFSQGGIPVANEVFVIDTADGSYTTFTAGLAGLETLGGQFYDEINGCIVAYGNLTEEMDGPIILNSTPANFTGWYALYVTNRVPLTPRTPGGKTAYARIWAGR